MRYMGASIRFCSASWPECDKGGGEPGERDKRKHICNLYCMILFLFFPLSLVFSIKILCLSYFALLRIRSTSIAYCIRFIQIAALWVCMTWGLFYALLNDIFRGLLSQGANFRLCQTIVEVEIEKFFVPVCLSRCLQPMKMEINLPRADSLANLQCRKSSKE